MKKPPPPNVPMICGKFLKVTDILIRRAQQVSKK